MLEYTIDIDRVQRVLNHADQHSRQPIDLNFIAIPKDDWEDLLAAVRIAEWRAGATKETT